jgi:hypothetical protein
LVGCFAVQADGLGMVLLHPLAIVIHEAKVKLSFGMSLVSRASDQLDHFAHVSLLRLCERGPRSLSTLDLALD